MARESKRRLVLVFVGLWVFLAVSHATGFTVVHRVGEPFSEIMRDFIPLVVAYLFHEWLAALVLTGVYAWGGWGE